MQIFKGERNIYKNCSTIIIIRKHMTPEMAIFDKKANNPKVYYLCPFYVTFLSLDENKGMKDDLI